MKSAEPKDWRHYLLRIGVILFVASVPTLIIGSLLFGEIGVAWPSVLMVNPSLMMIGAAIGLGDLFEAFSAMRAGELLKGGPFPAIFVIGRGLALSSIFCVFLWMEFRAVATLQELLS